MSPSRSEHAKNVVDSFADHTAVKLISRMMMALGVPLIGWLASNIAGTANDMKTTLSQHSLDLQLVRQSVVWQGEIVKDHEIRIRNIELRRNP